MTVLRVLVTRPAPEAQRWARELGARGIHAEALPLIDIVPAPLQGDLLRARQRLGDYHAAMFVSGNAVLGFLGSNEPQALDAPALDAIETRAWSPGPGTTAALTKAGWPAERIDAPAPDAPQFDSESLWARVSSQAVHGTRVLIVRGSAADGVAAGRDWLVAQLAAAGAVVDQVAAYRRLAPELDAVQGARACAAAGDGTLWLFSSSEAIGNLLECQPGVDWRGARALVTHPRIGEAARAAGFGAVYDTRPTLEAVAASIESLR
ncbi:uroporphyrinogen-III synthase [Ottowia sp. SB7-C50]|uniref:uroporphyrinogen-III synthase n=1 Tax=Ottowia sp. SB7-C50 TaxID=3081231 RepID=UPI0029550CCA|nr:uroporphyrinogen-III synthase [Ottowia sp. SB7-C50]WOP14521.1 uroporphyrinogen-III synthase [Ottowia sp. SB7-C50]